MYTFIVISAHAPHRSHKATFISKWWNSFFNMYNNLINKYKYVLVGMDGNVNFKNPIGNVAGPIGTTDVPTTHHLEVASLMNRLVSCVSTQRGLLRPGFWRFAHEQNAPAAFLGSSSARA